LSMLQSRFRIGLINTEVKSPMEQAFFGPDITGPVCTCWVLLIKGLPQFGFGTPSGAKSN
uniref:Transposase n=1 Tax=Rodentolepis nana TaxID=102285 RepID=A0A0R3THX5_RODNA